MTLRYLFLSVPVAAVLVAASPAAAANLADGTYQCTLGSALMGGIEIVGNTYKGPAYDGKYEGTYTFEVTEGGTINWNGPLGGLDSGGNKVVSTVLTDTGGGKTGFDFTIQLPSGNFSTVNCSL
jgi:hypothetical protein